MNNSKLQNIFKNKPSRAIRKGDIGVSLILTLKKNLEGRRRVERGEPSSNRFFLEPKPEGLESKTLELEPEGPELLPLDL